MTVTYLDKDKQTLMEAVEAFKLRVERGLVSDFVILGVNTAKEGYFTMLNVGNEIEQINLLLDMTKTTIVDMVMNGADVYYGDEIPEYEVEFEFDESDDEGEEEEEAGAEAEDAHKDGES